MVVFWLYLLTSLTFLFYWQISFLQGSKQSEKTVLNNKPKILDTSGLDNNSQGAGILEMSFQINSTEALDSFQHRGALNLSS